jgi:hypothetical protein
MKKDCSLEAVLTDSVEKNNEDLKLIFGYPIYFPIM